MLPTKFQINWLSFQEKKRKLDFQYGGHGGHLGYPIGMILAIFASHPDASYQVWSQLAFQFRRSDKKIFKMATMAAILDFLSELF